MYRTILIPLDGSERAEKILPHVESLVACTGARIALLRVIEPVSAVVPTHASWPAVYIDQLDSMVKEAETYLAGVMERLREKKISVEARVVHGPIVESIIQTAEEVDADLIAMASHGRSGLGSVFYGSVAAGVLQRAERPLLLIRSR